MKIENILPILLISLLTSCALAPSEPYKFYSGPRVDPSSTSIVKPMRTFGGPAIIINAVDGKYSLDYESMYGYPQNETSANRLEPQAILLAPGEHNFKIKFTFTDVVNKLEMITLLTLIGSSPVKNATFQKTADIHFLTDAGKTYTIRYLWNKSKGEKGITFYVEACDNSGQHCTEAPSTASNELSQIIPGTLSAQQLLSK